MTDTIQLDIIRVGATTLVIPTEDRLTSAAKVAERRAAELEEQAGATSDEEVAASLRMQAAAAREASSVAAARNRAIRDQHAGQVSRAEYPFRPYTYGEKQKARQRHTTFDGGAPRLDTESFLDELAAACLGLNVDQFRELPPAVAQALRDEAIERTEPSPERVDFLFSSPTTSPRAG